MPSEATSQGMPADPARFKFPPYGDPLAPQTTCAGLGRGHQDRSLRTAPHLKIGARVADVGEWQVAQPLSNRAQLLEARHVASAVAAYDVLEDAEVIGHGSGYRFVGAGCQNQVLSRRSLLAKIFDQLIVVRQCFHPDAPQRGCRSLA